MIKAKQFFISIGFDAKTNVWVGQDVSVHITLSVGKNRYVTDIFIASPFVKNF